MMTLRTLPPVHRIVLIASFPRSLVDFRGHLIRALLQAGLDVHVVAPGLKADSSTCESLEGWGAVTHEIAMQRAGTNPLQDLTALCSLYRLLREVRPDAVLGYTIKPVIYGTLAAWLARVPRRFVLITGLGYAFTGQATGRRALVQRLVCRLYAQALLKVERAFFQNPDDRDLFRDLGLLPDSIPSQVVNGSGIDTTHFAVAPLPSSPPVFLLIARLLGDKGVREYVAAARAIRARHPEVVFHLVGDVDDNPDSISRDELDHWIDEDHVTYLGQLSDVRPAIRDASVYVLPSYREGTPRTVLEAMAMGRPIITTDAPGCRETVIDGENGYLVPVRAVDELIVAMQRFIEDPDLVRRMGRSSREVAERKYDVNKVNRAMLEGMKIPRIAAETLTLSNLYQ